MVQHQQTQSEIPLAEASGQMAVNIEALFRLDAGFPELSVISRTLTAPPGGESEGDRYLVAASATGDWPGWDDSIALYHNTAWVELAPNENWRVRLDGTTEQWRYDGAAWVEASMEGGTVTTGITASVTQTQGQQPLTTLLNVVSTCANTSDVVTLPAAYVGRVCIVANDGAQTLQIFPASEDSINALGTDAVQSIVATRRWWGICADATTWVGIVGN